MKRRIIATILLVLTIFSVSVTSMAASYSTSYSVKNTTTKTRTLTNLKATHYFVKGGIFSADYVAMARGHQGAGEGVVAKMSITSSNGKKNAVNYFNTYAKPYNSGMKGILVANITKSGSKTSGKLWKATKSTNSSMIVYNPIYGTNTWTVKGK